MCGNMCRRYQQRNKVPFLTRPGVVDLGWGTFQGRCWPWWRWQICEERDDAYPT